MKKGKSIMTIFIVTVAVISAAWFIPNNPFYEMYRAFIQVTDPGTPGTTTIKIVEGELEGASERRLGGELQIQEIVVGSGPEVVPGSRVSLQYRGILVLTGEEFDRTRDGQTFDVVVGESSLIEGFTEGLLGIREQGKRVLFIKSSAAYGERGTGSIPPNSDLLFIIEAISVE